MKAMMTAMMTAAIKRRLFIFLPWPVSRASASAPGSRGAPAFRGWGGGGQLPERAEGLAVAPPARLGEPRGEGVLLHPEGRDLTAREGCAAWVPPTLPRGGIPEGSPPPASRGSHFPLSPWCSQGCGPLWAFHPYPGLLETLGTSYTCYGVRVSGKWAPSRICRGDPALNTPGSECRLEGRVGAPPARGATAPGAGTPLFPRAGVRMHPARGCGAQVWVWVWVGEWDLAGAASPPASDAPAASGLEQVPPTGHPGARPRGPLAGSGWRPPCSPGARPGPPAGPGLRVRHSTEPPGSPRPPEARPLFYGAHSPSLGRVGPLESSGRRRATVARRRGPLACA